MSICLTYTWLFLYLVAEKYNQLIEFLCVTTGFGQIIRYKRVRFSKPTSNQHLWATQILDSFL